jgi:hypothetical protein
VRGSTNSSTFLPLTVIETCDLAMVLSRTIKRQRAVWR